MAWWIPISWFEDLGGAKRKSLYKISTSPDISEPDDYSHYMIKCTVRYPNGEIRGETASFKAHNYKGLYSMPYIPDRIRHNLKTELREKIRKNAALQKALSGSEITSSAPAS